MSFSARPPELFGYICSRLDLASGDAKLMLRGADSLVARSQTRSWSRSWEATPRAAIDRTGRQPPRFRNASRLREPTPCCDRRIGFGVRDQKVTPRPRLPPRRALNLYWCGWVRNQPRGKESPVRGMALSVTSKREKYCHNGGMGPRPPSRRRLAKGSTMAIMAPSGGPLKTVGLQGKRPQVRVRALWGQQWTRLPFFS